MDANQIPQLLTIPEITELRKNGQLDRAFREADQLFTRFKNKFTATALFWCIYDTFKQEQEKERLEMLFDRMAILYDTYCQGDDFIHNAFNKVEIKIKHPLFFQLREAIFSAKNGDIDSGLNRKLETMWKEGEFPKYLHLEYAWLLYYSIKSTPTYELKERKKMFNRYLKLNAPKPSVLHSRILSEAIKTKQSHPDQFRIRDFIKLWGLENLIEQDWEQIRTDEGHLVTSTVEKLIGIYTKELKTNKVRSDEEFSKLVDEALLKIKNNTNLSLYKALVLVSQDKAKEALDYYRRLIIKSPSRCYLWQQAADLVEDENVKIGLLCKAISVERNEEFLGNCRLKLSHLLIRKGMYAEAKKELEIYKEFYISKGWHLKFEFIRVYHSLSSIIPTKENKYLYKEYFDYGEDFVYSGLPTMLAIKVNEKMIEDKTQKGRGQILWTLRTKERTLTLKNPLRFKSIQETRFNHLYNIIMVDEKIVWIKEIESLPQDVDWIKRVDGEVRLRVNANGNMYCVVDGVYVGSKLLRDIDDKQRVSVLAYFQEDKWSAVFIHPL